MDVKDYFLKEINNLLERMSALKEQTEDEKILSELNICETIVKDAQSFVEKEQFINAKDSVEEADKCISDMEDKIKEELKVSPPTMGYGVWIITWTLIGFLIIAIIFILYLLYKKFGIISFIRKKDETKQTKKGFEEDYFDKKIAEIEKKLKS